MAKSKNHTNHNQIRKAHRNGIKKPSTNYAKTLRFRNAKLRANQKYVTAGNMRVRKEKSAARLAERKA
ncbi:60S ribosomal protein L29 [Tulasnella sp. JGI-2019a]|nr:60S ribosomal protein L29 [Tulasnella sp. JGI-2019a]KAG9017009.1 60S ribosomal protein L29 [Tulasnella sp. JGI-2019a]KAG9040094.1 60S ribosomal protein L29 [Tulasnella sp. JGI-2019a]